MNKIDYKKFLDAVDTVCINCLKLSEENCANCPVRFTCDELNKKMNYKYYEVEFGILADGARSADYEASYSMAIKAECYPDISEIEEFLKEDIRLSGCDCVHGVTPIEEWEVHAFFDTSNIDNWPVFRK